MAVHVSIHDVSPAFEREVDVALDMAHALGIKPALLVVPDFHGRAALLESPRYVEKLRALQREGHEIYLHGYYHRARPFQEHAAATGDTGVRARLRHAFAQRVVSGGEAEMSDVSRTEAVERLERGERVLEDAGLTIEGYVAPAWSLPSWGLELLGARGYRFTEDHVRVYDPAAKTSRASLVLNYASRSPSRLLSTVAYCRVARPAARLVPGRVALHPADMRFALLRSEARSLLAWAARDLARNGRALLA